MDHSVATPRACWRPEFLRRRGSACPGLATKTTAEAVVETALVIKNQVLLESKRAMHPKAIPKAVNSLGSLNCPVNHIAAS